MVYLTPENVYVALARSAYGDWIDKAVDACSGFGGYSHAELVLARADGSVVWWSSFINADDQGHPAGVWPRQRDVSDPKWSIYRIPALGGRIAELERWCAGEQGSGYDVWGVLNFVFPGMKPDPVKWFCSELVVAALQQVGLFADERPDRVSPNRLRRLVRVFPCIKP